MALPKPSSFAGGVARVGVPLIGGFAGFITGDMAGAYGLVSDFMPAGGPLEGGLPFSSRIDYTAFLAMLPYGVGLAIVFVFSSIVPGDGAWWHVAIFRTAKWYLIGVLIHLALAGILPGRFQPSAPIGMPAIAR
jgi:hypothetical protein